MGERFPTITEPLFQRKKLDNFPLNSAAVEAIRKLESAISASSSAIPNAFSRIASSQSTNISEFIKIVHENFGHPGSTRMVNNPLVIFLSDKIKETNLQELVDQCLSSCTICTQQKPRVASVPYGQLVTSTAPWQRISIDCVGPKPSLTKNKYIFTVVDEFSHFPFAFPAKEPTSKSAIDNLLSLFTLFGPLHSVHSDRGRCFESHDFQFFLKSWNIIKTRTNLYHPEGNGQVERMHGTLLKTFELLLSLFGKQPKNDKSELPFALANMHLLPSRSLQLATPHESFFLLNDVQL